MTVRGGEKVPSRRKPLRVILAPTSPSSTTRWSSICLTTYSQFRGFIPLLPARFAHRFTARSAQESHFHGSRPYSRHRRKASARILSHVLTPEILDHPDYAYRPVRRFCLKIRRRPAKAADPNSEIYEVAFSYRPPAAAAVIIPAICMPSIRASTFSRLAPVSVHAST
jgi:hypothetical protein